MATEVLLRDGSLAVIWPLLPDDREGLAVLYQTLDPQTQYRRFLSAVPRLTESMLHHLVDEVDGIDHVALVLMIFDEDWSDHPAGLARMVRYPNDPEAADVAVTIREDFWGRGAATALLQELLARRPRGVRRIVTEVAADNMASIAMLHRLGPTRILRAAGPVLEVEVTLPPEQQRDDEQDSAVPGEVDGRGGGGDRETDRAQGGSDDDRSRLVDHGGPAGHDSERQRHHREQGDGTA